MSFFANFQMGWDWLDPEVYDDFFANFRWVWNWLAYQVYDGLRWVWNWLSSQDYDNLLGNFRWVCNWLASEGYHGFIASFRWLWNWLPFEIYNGFVANLRWGWKWLASEAYDDFLAALKCVQSAPWLTWTILAIAGFAALIMALKLLSRFRRDQDWWASEHYVDFLAVLRCARTAPWLTRTLLIVAGFATLITDHPIYHRLLRWVGPREASGADWLLPMPLRVMAEVLPLITGLATLTTDHPDYHNLLCGVAPRAVFAAAQYFPTPWRAMAQLFLPFFFGDRLLLALGLLMVQADGLLGYARVLRAFAPAASWRIELLAEAVWLTLGYYLTMPGLVQQAGPALSPLLTESLLARFLAPFREDDFLGPLLAKPAVAPLLEPPLTAGGLVGFLEQARVVAALAFWLGPHIAALARAERVNSLRAIVLLALRWLVIACHLDRQGQIQTGVLTLVLIGHAAFCDVRNTISRRRRPAVAETIQGGGAEGPGETDRPAEGEGGAEAE